jgi:MYXO-CTERM domain-containing protein
MLQFRLTVRDPAGLSNIATTAVIINTSNSAGGSSGGGALGLLLLLLLAGFRLRQIALNRTGGDG